MHSALSSDIVSGLRRSKLMASIRSSGNRTTEVRFSVLAKQAGLDGLFFRSCIARPADVCAPTLGLAVFLNGCFWHGCLHCYEEPYGKSLEWYSHLTGNRAKDLCDYLELARAGWRVLVLWEHELKGKELPTWFMREVEVS